jgi:hypothetical protein
MNLFDPLNLANFSPTRLEYVKKFKKSICSKILHFLAISELRKKSIEEYI